MKSQTSITVIAALALMLSTVALPIAQTDEEWDKLLAAAVIADAVDNGRAKEAASLIADAVSTGAAAAGMSEIFTSMHKIIDNGRCGRLCS